MGGAASDPPTQTLIKNLNFSYFQQKEQKIMSLKLFETEEKITIEAW